MGLTLDYQKHTLQFKFDAGTSRGVLREKDTWIIKISENGSNLFGLGECGPLKGLSIENGEEVALELTRLQHVIHDFELPGLDKLYDLAEELTTLASVRFALETAFLDLLNDGNRIIFDNSFSRGESGMVINGLVWMGEKAFMKSQIDEKIKAGFNCIKIKIGAIDFEEELSVLSDIRKEHPSAELIIRVDANGAFSPGEAMDKLKSLSQFNLHSIEQPIAPGQPDAMRQLCQLSPIPIALDEELTGVNRKVAKSDLLEIINPQYIILKPTLLGGIRSSIEWIKLAEDKKTGWWITSALESNIGLNAIAQLTSSYKVKIPQGLGTGKLYHNNIESPLAIRKGLLQYNNHKGWNYSELQDLINP